MLAAGGREAQMLSRGQEKEMHLCISPAERRVTISCGERRGGGDGTKVKGPGAKRQHHNRGYSRRWLLLAAAVLGVVLMPFLLSRTPFLTLNGATICCSINCLDWSLWPRMLARGNSQVGEGKTSARGAARQCMRRKSIERVGSLCLRLPWSSWSLTAKRSPPPHSLAMVT